MNSFRNFKFGIARTPPLSMAQGITTQKVTVDVHLAHEQHKKYLDTLNKLGISMTLLQPEEDLPDSHFVEDAAIIYNKTAILTRPGAPQRSAEVGHIKNILSNHGLDVLELGGTQVDTLDGGDVLFMGNHVFIGISYRTNISGAQALQTALQKCNPKLLVHFIEFSGVLHLKSGLIALNDGLLLGNPLMKFKQPFPFGKIIWLPKEEGYAANALIVNDAALVFDECKKTQAVLKQANLKPIPLNISEFHKMDGSFTCLSLLW